jgi:hypothetical protein
MDLTAWVDVAIGLALVYLGASLFVTIINEYIAQVLNLRGRQLRKSLEELIVDADVKSKLEASPALKSFFGTKAGKTPSYVDPNVLATLLVGGFTVASSAGTTVKQVADSIDAMTDSALKTQLQAIVRTTGDRMESLVAAVSDWTDRSLTMLGEGYKRRLQKISLGIGLAVAIGLNVDTVALTGHLYRDKEAREAVVALAVEVAEKTGGDVFDRCLAKPSRERATDAACAPVAGLVDAVQGRNASLGKLPIGWSYRPARPRPPAPSIRESVWLWTTRTVGWLLTALAVSLGAPFWFDLLNKLVNVRHGMRKPEVKQDQLSK